MERGRAQASAAEGVTEAVVFSTLLFLALLILGLYSPASALSLGAVIVFCSRWRTSLRECCTPRFRR